ncbi:MAG: SEL1-like repeat protein [Pseudomonadota bacterium]|nr:SEL1-like repeat protein [Pseudomonadota bacterium]
MVRTIKQSAILLAFVVIVAAFAKANAKYKEYMQQSLGNLLLMCTEGDDNGSYFYAEMQAKHSNLKEALNAHIIGAQNAKIRAGFVSMFQLARLYQHGQGVDRNLVQAYRWFSVMTQLSSQKDLNTAAEKQLQKLAGQMTPHQLTLAEALSIKGVRVN